MDWANADRDAVVSGTAVRYPMSVRDSGNMPPPMPANTIHSQDAPGAMFMPAYALAKQAPSRSRKGRWNRIGTLGAIIDAGMATADISATIQPAVSALIECSVRNRSNQPNATYACMD